MYSKTQRNFLLLCGATLMTVWDTTKSSDPEVKQRPHLLCVAAGGRELVGRVLRKSIENVHNFCLLQGRNEHVLTSQSRSIFYSIQVYSGTPNQKRRMGIHLKIAIAHIMSSPVVTWQSVLTVSRHYRLASVSQLTHDGNSPAFVRPTISRSVCLGVKPLWRLKSRFFITVRTLWIC
jgi:hypothetical protein